MEYTLKKHKKKLSTDSEGLQETQHFSGLGSLDSPRFAKLMSEDRTKAPRRSLLSPRNFTRNSVDFSNSRFLSPRIVKANHTIQSNTPKNRLLKRKNTFSTVTLNNRKVNCNLLLDYPYLK